MPIDRREFLHYSGIALVSASAYSFGSGLKPMVEKKPGKTVLIYGTRYGATKDTAYWIARGIDDQSLDVIDIEALDLDDAAQKYDHFIIGSGIWIDGAHPKLIRFLGDNKERIEQNILASFIVCGTTGEDEAGKKRIEGYFDRFLKPLDIKPKIQEHFGGRMIIDKLSDKDRKLLDHFYHKILKKEFASWDRTDPKKAQEFGVLIGGVISE